jgi:helix-turn-helix protein
MSFSFFQNFLLFLPFLFSLFLSKSSVVIVLSNLGDSELAIYCKTSNNKNLLYVRDGKHHSIFITNCFSP